MCRCHVTGNTNMYVNVCMFTWSAVCGCVRGWELRHGQRFVVMLRFFLGPFLGIFEGCVQNQCSSFYMFDLQLWSGIAVPFFFKSELWFRKTFYSLGRAINILMQTCENCFWMSGFVNVWKKKEIQEIQLTFKSSFFLC